MISYIARLFYLGDNYYGSQYQPGLITVQGELIEAMNQWSKDSHSPQTVRLSGRTDRGVHSIGQIVHIVSERELNIDKVNRYLPADITLWAVAPAPQDFNPRFDVLFRHYRYYFGTDSSISDVQAMQLAVQSLCGTHDFRLFSKPDGDRPTKTTILNVCLFQIENGLVMDIFGTNFLWKMVRKTVSLLAQIGKGTLDLNLFSNALSGKKSIVGGIRPASPEGLVLIETATSIRMTASKYAIARIQNYLNDRQDYLQRSYQTLAAINADDFFHQRNSF